MTDNISDSLNVSLGDSLTYSQLNKLAQAFYDNGTTQDGFMPNPDGDAAYLLKDLNFNELPVDLDIDDADLDTVKAFLSSHNLILMWDMRWGLKSWWPKPGDDTDQSWSDICADITNEWGDYKDDNDNEGTDNV